MRSAHRFIKPRQKWRRRIQEIIYETSTPAGKAFDVALLTLILFSIIVVMLDSIAIWHLRYGHFLHILEWVFTILFTIEYLLRIISLRKPFRYIFSFFGLVDLLSILPSYLSFFVPGGHALVVFRALRLLRIFRIFKLTHFLLDMRFLGGALKNSLRKISIFMLTVLSIVVILGSLMYLIEGQDHGFTSIPESIYWAIVTITTVGYGDISPATAAGKALASITMLFGYAIIAVPTGIIGSEMFNAMQKDKFPNSNECSGCGEMLHSADALYCRICGEQLPNQKAENMQG